MDTFAASGFGATESCPPTQTWTQVQQWICWQAVLEQRQSWEAVLDFPFGDVGGDSSGVDSTSALGQLLFGY